jgi:hypothetical protein
MAQKQRPGGTILPCSNHISHYSARMKSNSNLNGVAVWVVLINADTGSSFNSIYGKVSNSLDMVIWLILDNCSTKK